jgi:streptogramin lyase
MPFYFFSGHRYIRVTREELGPGSVDRGYPKPISEWGWGDFGKHGISAALYSGPVDYFFSGSHYIRVTRGETGPGVVDPGYPKPISDWGWGEFGKHGIDAALYRGPVDYFFSGSSYIRVTRGETGHGVVDPGYPKPISEWGWGEFGKDGISAALYSGPVDYFFSRSHYIRVTRRETGPGTVDPGYPKPISDWGWGEFGEKGISAALFSGFEIPHRKDRFLLVSSQTGSPVSDAVLSYNATSGASVGTFAFGGGLSDPLGLDIGPDGNLYVASGNGNNVLRFDGDTGAFIGVFASGGGLDAPTNVVFGPDRNLYVSSFNSANILQYDGITGSFIDTFASGGGLLNPRGLVFGPDTNLYVVDYNNAQVLRYLGTNGSFMGVFVTPGSGGLSTPSDLAFGPDGNLYVTGGTFDGSLGVFRYDGGTGAFKDLFAATPSGAAPIDLVFGPDRNLYVTVQGAMNGVLRFDGTTGAFIDAFVPNGSGGLQNPFGLIFA